MRQLHTAIVFFSITLLCVVSVNSFILAAGRTYKDGAAIICEEKRNAVHTGKVLAQPGRDNVLFLGHSTVLAGLVPRQFDELTRGRTYSWNLSLPALPIGPHYFVLRDYLLHNSPPQFAILQLTVDEGERDGHFDKYAVEGSTFDEIKSYAISRSDMNVLWNYVHPIRLYRQEVFRYLRDLLSDPQAMERTRSHNRAIIEKMLVERGYYLIQEQASASGRLSDDFRELSDGAPEAEVHPENDPYVERFFDLAHEQDIRVLLIETPLRPAQKPQRATMPAWYHQLLARYDNIRMANKGWKFKFYENRLFADPIHLNAKGAERFTAEVYAEFVEAFGFA